MCENCFQTSIYRFDTYHDFEAFEDKLQRKCAKKQLTIVDRQATDYLSTYDSCIFYKCRNCNEVWALSIPDNAWRGFFLPEDKALEYIKRYRKDDKKKSFGCMVVLVISVLIIIWILIQ